MPKNPVSGWIASPLDAILSTRAKVGVLRVLARSSVPLGYREVARRTGMAYRGIELAIKDLVAVGLLDRIDGSRERLVALSRGHRLAPALEALLRAEADLRPALRAELAVLARGVQGAGLVAAAVLGAAARGEERIGDPLELLLLAETGDAADRAKRAFERRADELGLRYGVRLAVTAYDLATARRLWGTRTAAAERNVRGAEGLVGAPIAELLDSR